MKKSRAVDLLMITASSLRDQLAVVTKVLDHLNNDPTWADDDDVADEFARRVRRSSSLVLGTEYTVNELS